MMNFYRLRLLSFVFAGLIVLATGCSEDPGESATDDPDAGISGEDASSTDEDAGPGDDTGEPDDAGTEEDTGDDVGADTGQDAGNDCPEDEQLCNGECVDIATDVAHCGACNESCTVPDVEDTLAVCIDGSCDVECTDDQTFCTDEVSACVDTDDDIDHCGACNDECFDDPNGDVWCEDGECHLSCDDGYTDCGGECVDTDHDVDHCGGCDDACTGDAICEFGTCYEGPECDELGDPFGGGNGSAGDPFLICTFEQLANIDDHLTDHFVLRNDLDFAETSADFQQDFEPLADLGGSFADEFEGSFDGMGRTISNLDLSFPEWDQVGLFRTLDTDGSISNLHLDEITVEGRQTVGSLVGRSNGTIENVTASGVDIDGQNRTGGLVGQNGRTIENAVVDGVVEGTFSVGGLAGESLQGDISEAVADVDVEATERRAGGLVGTVDGGTVTDSEAHGNAVAVGDTNTAGGLIANIQGSTTQISNSHATGDVEGALYVGGFAGVNEGVIDEAYATGDIEGDGNVGGFVGTNRGEITGGHATGDIEGQSQIGGFVGHLEEGKITDSYTESTVVGTDASIGGFVGLAEDRISRSFATGEVNPQPQPAALRVGGFGGQITEHVVDSYALGDVRGNDDVGGFVGDLNGSGSFSDGLLHACYSFGEPIGSETTGGLVASNTFGEVSASYWNSETSNTTDSDGGQALTDDQFSDQSTFDDPSDPNDAWNFDDTWEMSDDDDRPVLQWQP